MTGTSQKPILNILELAKECERYKAVQEYDPRLEIVKRREYKVVKANEMIQKAKYDLSTIELKIMSYIFSMIKPTDKEGKEYTFSVQDFCRVCGIDPNSGKNYSMVKSYLKGLRDKSFWLTKEDGSMTTVGWIAKATITPKSGVARIRLEDEIAKYVIDLVDTPYTQYELACTLPMKSQYSIRIYELLKSYAFRKGFTFDVDELKDQLAAAHYQNFKDFRVKVLEPATKEINLYTDLEVSWYPIKKGKKVIQITFAIREKSPSEYYLGMINRDKVLNKRNDDQISLNELIPDAEKMNYVSLKVEKLDEETTNIETGKNFYIN